MKRFIVKTRETILMQKTTVLYTCENLFGDLEEESSVCTTFPHPCLLTNGVSGNFSHTACSKFHHCEEFLFF